MNFDGWRKMRLGDTIVFNPRESISKTHLAKKIPMEKLQPFSKFIADFDIAEFNGGSKFRNGDTLLARITPCLENGKTSQVTILENNEVGFGSTEYIVLREKVGITDKDYIYYLAISPDFRNIAIQSMVGTSGRQRVQQDVLENQEIEIPPLAEQKAIASTLSALDDKIEINKQMNKKLEEIAQAIFKSWFVDFEPFKDGEFEESELDMIPKGWRIGTISDLGDVVGGATPSKKEEKFYTKEGIPWITPKDLSENKNKYISKGEIDITEEGYRNSSTQLMPKGTVLFSSRAPIGYIAISQNEVTTNQGFKSVVPKSEVGSEFVYYFLKSNLSTIESRASGSTFKEISGAEMKKIPALIPSSEALSEFKKVITPIAYLMEKCEGENDILINIRDLLLPKLMSGRIRVPVEGEVECLTI